MKVSVIGPGALGCLFAARLAQAGIKVTLVDHRSDRVARLARSGISIETREGSASAKPAVSIQVPARQDFHIVCVKSYSTGALKLTKGASVLTLQSGLGNVERLCAMVGSANVMAGVTHDAATWLAEGRVRHSISGTTTFGSWTTCETKCVEKAFSEAGIAYQLTDSPGRVLWENVAVGAGIGPLTALLGIENGRLVEIGDVRQLLRDLVVEAAKVATTEGYKFEYSLVERAEEMCRQTASALSPMLQDVRADRLTEVEQISGEILRRAELASLPAPRTRVVYQLMKGLEQR